MKRLLLLFTISVFGQVANFSSETRLVIVDLTVKDKSGKAITTLKASDIEIYEDGVKQKVTVFEPQKLSTDPLAPVSLAAN
jgi:hypothetical protein